MTVSVAVIGECMLELSHASSKNVDSEKAMWMKYGGDTINTSVYLARNGVSVSYVTGLGDDIMSDWLIEQWEGENVDCSMVTRMPNSVPGMYMINVTEEGERSFLYWRKNSPASRLFDNKGAAEVTFQSISGYPYLYLSGISLAILAQSACEHLIELMENYRRQGGKIIFDGNYRCKLWPTPDIAREVYTRVYKITDIALPTFEDEAELFGYDSVEEVLKSISELGPKEIVVKMGSEGCLVFQDDEMRYVQAHVVDPVDTTAAGDSFNAGYLAARFSGKIGPEACFAGHALASQVIQYQGAIIPRS